MKNKLITLSSNEKMQLNQNLSDGEFEINKEFEIMYRNRVNQVSLDEF